MAENKRIIHGVMHTHWDREWYFTDNEASILLIYHMDEVIEELKKGTIDYYTLDGQMSIVEDYLKIFPQKTNIVKELVLDNKLVIGPWYTQVDEFLTSGESYIRNLELGMDMADDLGGTMKVGYLPDSFGQSQDMPKILNGFGIDTFIFWRGLYNPDKSREFYWTSADGSKVLASNIEAGYFEGRDIIELDDKEHAQNILKANLNRSKGKNTLIPFGWDQRPIYRNLPKKVDDINKSNEDFEVVQSTYDDYFDELKKEDLDIETRTGEFMYAVVSKIHRSIYSSRYDIKKLNDIVERKLTYVLEPLMTLADKKGITYKKEILDEIWKKVIDSQAHDSLGGCNSDKTNQNILNRGKQALELTDSTIDYLMKKLVSSDRSIQHNELVIANPLPYTSKPHHTFEIATKLNKFKIVDDNNKDLDFDIVRQMEKSSAHVTRNFDEPISEEDSYFITTIVLNYQSEPYSFSKIKILENAENNITLLEKSEASGIENKYYKIFFENGQVKAYLKDKDKLLDNFIFFTDGGDEGDNYDYSPAYEDNIYNLDFENIEISVVKGKYQQELKLQGYWKLPYDLKERAVGKCSTDLPYEITICLNNNDRRIDFKVKIDNSVKDHRLRLILNSPIKSDYSHAGTQFGSICRANEDLYLSKWKELKWREEPTSLYPLLNYVNIHDDTLSLTAFTKGMKEYQVTGENFNELTLTLFRSVGYLGRPDLLRRPGAASGTKDKYIETPDSQLLKEMEFEFAVLVDDELDYSAIYKEYLLYVQELPYYQNQELNRFFNPMSYFMINKHKNVSKLTNKELSFNLRNNRLAFSSTRQNEEQLEIRVFNPTDKALNNEEIEFNEEIDYQLVNFRNEPLSEKRKGKKLRFETLKPGEIQTIIVII